jgi:gas vesicle protein
VIVVWILLAALVVVLATAAALWFALHRAKARATASEAVLADAHAAVAGVVRQEAIAQAEELRGLLERSRADSLSLFAEQERRVAEERRRDVLERERAAGESLAAALAESERRVQERLRGWQEDLERAQRHLEAQLGRLAQRQEQLIAEAEARIEAEASQLVETSDEQRAAVLRLRDELEQAAQQAVAEALDELQSHTVERRRVIEDIAERLRAREAAISEQIERAEADARSRVDASFADIERRQLEQLERLVERETTRYAEVAAQQFEVALKAAREDAATRLGRELDRAADSYARQADALFAERMNETANQASQQLERRIRQAQTSFERQRDEITESLQQRLSDADAELRKTLGAMVADAEAERSVLEARIQELTRRLDELAMQAALHGR